MHQRANRIMNWSEITVYWEFSKNHPWGIGKWKRGKKSQKKMRINKNMKIVNYWKIFLLGYYLNFWFIHKHLLYTSAKLEHSHVQDRTRKSSFQISSVSVDRFWIFSGGIRGKLLAIISQIRILVCKDSAWRKCCKD